MGAAVLACDHTRRNAPEIVAALNAAMVATPSNDPDAPVFRTHSTGRMAPGRVICLPLVDTQPGGNSEKRAPASSDQENGSDNNNDNDTNDTNDTNDNDNDNDNDTNDGHNAGDTWRDSLLTPKVHVEEKRAVREVHQAVDWIVDHLRGTSDRASDPPVLTSDIMVIARTNARLGLMQRELAARGIACAQPEKSTLIESPVVADMVALLDGLVSPSADLAIAQALRSPLFGASDGRPHVVGSVRRALPTPWRWPLVSDHAAHCVHAECGQAVRWWGSALANRPPSCGDSTGMGHRFSGHAAAAENTVCARGIGRNFPIEICAAAL